MSDAKNIKDQTKINSGDVTPEGAAKDIDQLKDEELGKVSGGVKDTVGTPYGDWLG